MDFNQEKGSGRKRKQKRAKKKAKHATKRQSNAIRSRIAAAETVMRPIPSYDILLSRVHSILGTKDPISEDKIRIIIPYIASHFASHLKFPIDSSIESYVQVALTCPNKKVFVKAVYDTLNHWVGVEANQVLRFNYFVLYSADQFISHVWQSIVLKYNMR